MVFSNLESKVFQAFLKEVLEGFFYKAWCLGKLDQTDKKTPLKFTLKRG